METLYLVCALVGGTLIFCHFLLTLFGLGHHDSSGHDFAGHEVGSHDAGGHDAGSHEQAPGHHEEENSSDSSWFLGMLTFRTLSAALAFFGLTGLGAGKTFSEPWPPLGLALLAGLAAFYIVGKLVRFLSALNVDGTIHIERSLGASGTVYLGIPGQHTGTGKVHVHVLSRTMEYNAITQQDALPTGVPIVVLGVVNADTVEVASASSERTSHASPGR